MTLEIKKDNYYLLLMFAGGRWPNGKSVDFLFAIYKEGEKGDPLSPWLVQYRFRYHKDGRVFGSEDVKSWYTGAKDGATPTEEVLASCKMFGQAIADMLGGELRYEPVDGDGEKLIKVMSTCDFCHMHVVSPEEGLNDT